MAYSSSWRGSICSHWRARRYAGSALLIAGGLLASGMPAAAATQRLPALWLSDLHGGRAPLDSLLGARPALLLFWSTPCQSCLDKLRAVEAFAQARAEQDLALLMVNIDAPRNKNQIAPFLHRFEFTAPCFVDPERAAFRKLGGREAPYLVLLSAEREVLYRSGSLDRRDLTAIAALLEAQDSAGSAHD